MNYMLKDKIASDIFTYFGIDESNVSMAFDVNMVPDCYILHIMDILSERICLKYRYYKGFEEPYMFSDDNNVCGYSVTRNEALFKYLLNICKLDILSNKQKEELFYVISYISNYGES